MIFNEYDNIFEDEDVFIEDELNNNKKLSIEELLASVDYKHIFLSSDWHLFKNHYKKEANYVNTSKIVSWCKNNIKDEDVFIYLGDLSYRWVNDEDIKEVQRIFKSLPGIKILVLGNHDIMAGEKLYGDCGFDYIVEEIRFKNLIFTHKPLETNYIPEEFWNIHGHLHKWQEFNTSDGARCLNVYPWYFNNQAVTLYYLLKHKNKLTKDNKASDWIGMGESAAILENTIDVLDGYLIEVKRSELDDSIFGIPEDRRYPLDTEQHVKSAIRLFGHCEERKKKSLAKNIKKAADKYDIEIPENTQVYKYLNEWSAASMNPIVGIHKPFLIKIGDQGLLSNTKYALATDIIPSKCLVVNEDGYLEIINGDSILESITGVYQFVGHDGLVDVISEAYNSKTQVDYDFIYTTLSGKKLLCEDQIDYNSEFIKVDFNKYLDKSNTIIATTEAMMSVDYSLPVLGYDECYRKDPDGYFYINNITNKRTKSVDNISNITESMIASTY